MYGIEIELNKMKADSLADSGRRLEILTSIINRESGYVCRMYKILKRIEENIDKQKWRKRRIWKAVKERGAENTARSESSIRKLKEERKKIYDSLIIQREAMGLTDHTWIDKYYGNKE